MSKIDRRTLLKMTGAAAAGFYLIGCGKDDSGSKTPPPGYGQPAPDPGALVAAHRKTLAGAVAVAKDDTPYNNTKKAIALLGGMAAFVKPGMTVVVKPNIGWNRPPTACATTNPDVVRAIVEECIAAGAKVVEVYDRPCEDKRRAYARSGIEAAATVAGATVRQIEDYEYAETEIPRGVTLRKWPVASGILRADVVINVPIAKDHDSAALTMCMKNLMGVMGGSRGEIHVNMGQKLADFSTLVVPTLNILDANSILVAHGPQGGTPEDIRSPRMIIAGVEAATVDAYGAANLPWQMAPGRKVDYLEPAGALGLGVVDPSKIRVIGG